MTSVDNRVVLMDFDNKKFEKGVNQTIKDLDTLEKKMQFGDSGKGFSKLEALANGLKLDGIKNAVESVNDKFSVMGVVAFNVISRITNAGLDMFNKLSAATIGSIVSGGSTRALNLEQARFQMQGLGMDVEAVMADVAYAVDGTAYSLDAAAKVAGQLGASGIQAGDQMKSSLRGVSGLAAMTGSSYEDIGSIFTKVAGQGRLMGDDLLRLSSRGINGAATLAQYMGKTESEVRDLVTKGQISFQTFSDAMNETFGDHATKANETFSGAMMNVKSALGRIGAKFFTPFYQNARDVLNAIRPKINELSAALDPAFKTISAGMQQLSGFIQQVVGKFDFSGLATSLQHISDAIARIFQIGQESGEVIPPQVLSNVYAFKRILNGLENIVKGVGSVLKNIGGAFAEVFPVDLNNGLKTFTLRFEILTQKLILGESKLELIRAGFVRFFTIVKSVATVVGSVLTGAFRILQPILSIIGKVIGYILSIFGGFTSALSDGVGPAEAFASVISTISTKIADFINKISNGLPSVEGFNNFINGIKEKFQELSGSISEKIPNVLVAIGNGFQTLSRWAGIAVETVGNFIKNIDWNKVFLGGAAIGTGVGIFGLLKNFIGMFGEAKGVVEGFKDFVKNLSGPLESLSGILQSYQQNIQASAILKIAGAIGILAVSLMILSTIDPAGLMSGISAMAALMVQMTAIIAVLNKMNPAKMTGVSSSLLIMSFALLVMSAAMKNLASMSWEEVAKGTVALLVLSGVLIGLTAAMNAIKSQAIGGAMSMIVIGVALLVLSEALKSLGLIDQGVLVQGFVTMTAALATLVIALNFMKSAVGGAVSMFIVAGALIVLSEALERFGTLPLEVLKQGGVTIAVMLTALVIAVNLMKRAIGGAFAMLIIAAALLVLSGVIAILGAMPIEQIVQGMIVFIAMLAAFVVVGMLLAPIAVQVLLVSVALVIFATGLMIAAAALIVMSIGLNLLMMAGLPAIGMLFLLGLALIPLAILSPLLFLFGAGMLFMGVGLLAAGAGLVLFSAAGIGAVGILLALGLAMIPLVLTAPLMFVVGAAMLLLGVASVVLGAGLIVLSLAFTLLNSSLPMGIVVLQRLGEVAIEMIPAAAAFVVLGAALIVLGAGAIVGGAGLLVLGVGLLLAAAGIAVFSIAVTSKFTKAVDIFDEAMGTFVWHVPGMLAAGAALLVFGAGVMLAGMGALAAGAGFLILEVAMKLFTNTYPKLEQAMTKFVTVTEKLEGIIPSLESAGTAISSMSTSVLTFGMGVTTAATGTTMLATGVLMLSKNIQTATTTTAAGSALISASMTMLVASVSGSVTLIQAQYTRFGTVTKSSMTMVTTTMSSSSTQLISVMTSMTTSISNSINQIQSQFARMGPAISNGISTAIPIAQQAGQNIVQGCINGMGQMMTHVYRKGEEVGAKAVEGVNAGAKNASPSKATFKSGINIDQGAINGMMYLLTQVGRTGELVGVTAADSVSAGFKTLDDSFGSNGFSPTVTPVVDLRQVQNARSSLQASTSGFAVDSNVASKIAVQMDKTHQNLDEQMLKQLQLVSERVGMLENVSSSISELSGKLEGMKVEMDSVPVGILVAPTVSQEIRADQRRAER